jgi:hypothetical protein
MKHLLVAIMLCASLSACGMHNRNMTYKNHVDDRAGTLNHGWDYEPRDPKKHRDHDAWDRDYDGAYDDWSRY